MIEKAEHISICEHFEENILAAAPKSAKYARFHLVLSSSPNKLNKMQPYTKNKSAFELKGSMFTLTVLHLFDADIHNFTAQLRYHAQKTPNLFKSMPLVIDLQRIADPKLTIDFPGLQHQLREHGLIPVGVRHGNEQSNHAAQLAGLAVLSNQPTKAKVDTINKPALTAPTANTMLVTKPVRSGQQIYAKNANLVIVAPVNHGAEILADGYIHVYDCLRGRALAGINGDVKARIFCHKIEAELISIAGHYLLHDHLPKVTAPMVQAYLHNDKICIEGLPE